MAESRLWRTFEMDDDIENYTFLSQEDIGIECVALKVVDR